jgi:hypothetical protein
MKPIIEITRYRHLLARAEADFIRLHGKSDWRTYAIHRLEYDYGINMDTVVRELLSQLLPERLKDYIYWILSGYPADRAIRRTLHHQYMDMSKRHIDNNAYADLLRGQGSLYDYDTIR